jgi:hypothetical protein
VADDDGALAAILAGCAAAKILDGAAGPAHDGY